MGANGPRGIGGSAPSARPQGRAGRSKSKPHPRPRRWIMMTKTGRMRFGPILKPSFYQRDSVTVARGLLGKLLVRDFGDKVQGLESRANAIYRNQWIVAVEAPLARQAGAAVGVAKART